MNFTEKDNEKLRKMDNSVFFNLVNLMAADLELTRFYLEIARECINLCGDKYTCINVLKYISCFEVSADMLMAMVKNKNEYYTKWIENRINFLNDFKLYECTFYKFLPDTSLFALKDSTRNFQYFSLQSMWGVYQHLVNEELKEIKKLASM